MSGTRPLCDKRKEEQKKKNKKNMYLPTYLTKLWTVCEFVNLLVLRLAAFLNDSESMVIVYSLTRPVTMDELARARALGELGVPH